MNPITYRYNAETNTLFVEQAGAVYPFTGTGMPWERKDFAELYEAAPEAALVEYGYTDSVPIWTPTKED